MGSLADRWSYGATLTRKCGQPGLHRVRDEPHTTPAFSTGIDDTPTILPLGEEDLPKVRAALGLTNAPEPTSTPRRGQGSEPSAISSPLRDAPPEDGGTEKGLCA